MSTTSTTRSALWYREITPYQWKALSAATLGWVLDSMDVYLFIIAMPLLLRHFGMTRGMGGFLSSLTLIASAFGGVAFGFIADRFGRTRSMMASILIYSIFTAACGFAQTITQLAVFRFLLGLGVGGEWSTGAALISETWPEKHRGKAFGIMQSGFALGFALAAAVAAVVLPHWGWRGAFFVGILPALITLWLRKNVEEPETWRKARAEVVSGHRPAPRLSALLAPGIRRNVVVASLVSISAMFAIWGLFSWLPSMLAQPVAIGGAGLGNKSNLFIVVMNLGSFCGYLSFGVLADKFPRKRVYLTFLFTAAVAVALYASTRNLYALFLAGPIVGFFGAGHVAGFGAITGELFPLDIRATAQGFTYNIGRGVSALAPLAIGHVADLYGFTRAFYFTAVAYLVTALCVMMFPGKPKQQVLVENEFETIRAV
jgi:MFS family permease